MTHSDEKLDGQSATRRVYEDIEVARAFTKKTLENRQIEVPPHLRTFAESLAGPRLIDLGCGPGIHAQQFADLGFAVTAIDYSEAMIQIARERSSRERSSSDNPAFLRLDMREIGTAFAAQSFDGAWISASLIHVPESDVPTFLHDLHRILTPSGRTRISLKMGPQGPQMIHDDKYGIGIERQFIFWQEDNFAALLREANFTIDHIETAQGGMTGNSPTTWIIFSAHTNAG
ncbi:hypothetical protein CCAX7_20790 [Capsulimonas corticalis]|uniref:Uncharacterized protein n=2 Tax=Capsulimonas corticalis TaxID=2219043 RepID=A0A402D297_9BACT|nr:hypothetical protein CCAX7_20790 [Capsulimonas corticalis]